MAAILIAKLIESWAKSPFLHQAEVLVVGQCVQHSHPELFAAHSEGRVVLTVCPEAEQPIFGKLASMLTSTRPAKLTVLTVDCSPDCYTLQAGVNEAFYISRSTVPREHLVILQGQVHSISPAAIRLSRYLTLTQYALEQLPELRDRLEQLSLEHRAARQPGHGPGDET